MLDFPTATGLRVINTGTAIQVEWDDLQGGAAAVPVDGERWASAGGLGRGNGSAAGDVRIVPVVPLQFHLHSTSEHLLEGARGRGRVEPFGGCRKCKALLVPQACTSRRARQRRRAPSPCQQATPPPSVPQATTTLLSCTL